jgi:hypothetical protein
MDRESWSRQRILCSFMSPLCEFILQLFRSVRHRCAAVFPPDLEDVEVILIIVVSVFVVVYRALSVRELAGEFQGIFQTSLTN